MIAMLLAAGYGRRMRPLTDLTPKPLLEVAGKPLLQYHIERLRTVGVRDLVVNIAHLGEQIRDWLGDGSRFSVRVAYSTEPYPLETGGALLRALPLLGEQPFLLVNGDIWTDYPLADLLDISLASGCLGHLVLVPNPQHRPQGDFGLHGRRVVHSDAGQPSFTFSGISLLRPQLIADYPERREVFPLREPLRRAIDAAALEGEVFRGQWWDIGTPQRLQELDTLLR